MIHPGALGRTFTFRRRFCFFVGEKFVPASRKLQNELCYLRFTH